VTLIRNLFFLISITIFAVASTAICVFNYSPINGSRALFLDFYISFGIALAGVLAIIIYYLKVNIKKDKTIFNHFWPSVRQAILASLAVTIILFLQGLHILDWLIAISITVITVLLELFFQTKK
jgi:hypothetical protein